MEETISLKELLQTLRKRMNLIVLMTLVAMIISGVYSFFIATPIYQSSTQMLVNHEKNDQQMYNTAEIQSNIQLIKTYNVIITSGAILDIVIDELQLNESVGSLKNKITVRSVSDSQVVNLTVQDSDPQKAAFIANKTAEVFQKEIIELMNVDNVKIIVPAEIGENASPVKPQPVLNIAIAMVIGLMLGTGLAFLLEYLDQTIKTEQDVEQVLDLPVLGSIATFDQNMGKKKKRAKSKSRVGSESIG